jgi:biopolymer transport protein ExbD
MNFATKNQSNDVTIEITPLIDIVFLLVIFFVVTSKIDTNQALNIDLPETSSFSSVLVENQEMIYLYESGKLRYGDISVDIESSETLISFISSQIPKSELVTLAIEKRAYHEWVLQLMDDLQLSGYQNIQIRTYQE